MGLRGQCHRGVGSLGEPRDVLLTVLPPGGLEGEQCFQILPRSAKASDSIKMADGKPSGTADGKRGCKTLLAFCL